MGTLRTSEPVVACQLPNLIEVLALWLQLRAFGAE
jgi:hypothetical protein